MDDFLKMVGHKSPSGPPISQAHAEMTAEELYKNVAEAKSPKQEFLSNEGGDIEGMRYETGTTAFTQSRMAGEESSVSGDNQAGNDQEARHSDSD